MLGRMRKLFPLIVAAVFGSVAYKSCHRGKLVAEEADTEESAFEEEDLQPEADEPRVERARPREPEFECSGRTRCTEMRSCQEAKWVSKHCPGTQMDGDHDGIPCEDQFCGH